MQFSITFIVEDSEPMVHHNLGLLLRKAGYSLLPDGHYQRGSQDGTMLLSDPSMWFTRLRAETSCTPDYYTRVKLSYDVQTAGQSLKYHIRGFWLIEVNHFVTALDGRTDSVQEKLEQALGLDVQPPLEEVSRQAYDQFSLTQGQSKLRNQYESQMRNCANWFFWIAALSLLTSIINLLKADLSLIFGLGATQVMNVLIDLLIEGIPEGWVFFRATAFLVNLLILAIFTFFGLQARRGKVWAFIFGIGLYFLDGIIFLLVGEWFAVLFHAIAMYVMVRGYLALRVIARLDEEQVIRQA